MGRGRDDVGVRHGIEVAGEHLACDQAGEVCHIDHQGGAHFIGNFAHLGEVHCAGIRAITTDDHEWFKFASRCSQLVVVEHLGFTVDGVRALIEHFARDVWSETMGQMAASVKGHAQHALVAELMPELVPVCVGQVVDVFRFV